MWFSWSDEFIVGVDRMDDQHKTLVELLNNIQNLLEKGEKARAKEIFTQEIAQYLENHLRDEEEFMKSIGYPEFETHKKAHDQFRSLMAKSLEKIKAGDEEEFRTAVAMTMGWLLSHIKKCDTKYGKYYNQEVKSA